MQQIARCCIPAALLLILGCLAIGARSEATPEEEALLDHVKQLGGLVKFEVGRECSTCLRGAVASETINEGELAMALPLDKLAIPLAALGNHAFAAEYAYHYAINQATNPDFNKTHALYLATLPPVGTVLTGEMFTEELLDHVHSPTFKRLLDVQKSVAEGVYFGNLTWKKYEPLYAKLGDKTPSLEEFKHLCALIGSRDFALNPPPGVNPNSVPYYMIPVADLVNHHENPNAVRTDNGTHVLMKALRTIEKGEEITNNYQSSVLHRNDMSLLIYGFLQNQPVMCASDLPTYNPKDPYGRTPMDDSEFYGPNGSHNTEAEFHRLTALLLGMPTTETEDVHLLETSRSRRNNPLTALQCKAQELMGKPCAPPLNERQETVIEFRLHRRRTIRAALRKINQELKRQGKAVKDGEMETKDELK